MSSVTLVGAGPGDPELLTLKAVRAIERADVILIDDLVNPEILAFAPSGARVIQVGKRGGCASTPQEFIERLMIAEARAGHRVVRLKGGDGPTTDRRTGQRRPLHPAHAACAGQAADAFLFFGSDSWPAKQQHHSCSPSVRRRCVPST
jgi:uroporphyrin-III C-methyltransferase